MKFTTLLLVAFLGLLAAFGYNKFIRIDLGATKLKPRYDYIVVGSGSAGGVLAARLSEDPKVSVLLLEAGPDYDDIMIRAPAGSALLQNIPTDWAFRSTKQEHAVKGLKNGQMSIPQGRMLGGSSQMNYMAYVRGNRGDYDRVAKITGEDAWSYENVLPLFKKHEDILIPELRGSKYHGQGGEIGISFPLSNLTITKAVVQSLVEIGLPFNPDYNGAE